MDSEKEIVEKYSTDKKLNCHVRCQKCPSLVLCKNDARVHEEKFSLPGFSIADPETELNFWWRVDDMFDFANIGFRKFSDKTRAFNSFNKNFSFSENFIVKQSQT